MTIKSTVFYMKDNQLFPTGLFFQRSEAVILWFERRLNTKVINNAYYEITLADLLALYADIDIVTRKHGLAESILPVTKSFFLDDPLYGDMYYDRLFSIFWEMKTFLSDVADINHSYYFKTTEQW